MSRLQMTSILSVNVLRSVLCTVMIMMWWASKWSNNYVEVC